MLSIDGLHSHQGTSLTSGPAARRCRRRPIHSNESTDLAGNEARNSFLQSPSMTSYFGNFLSNMERNRPHEQQGLQRSHAILSHA
uniref:Uncharacterized protein n=1 Tax=Panagrellus redivivus TaxID=6233 RepID=A0A7E4ZTK5_PANRE